MITSFLILFQWSILHFVTSVPLRNIDKSADGNWTENLGEIFYPEINGNVHGSIQSLAYPERLKRDADGEEFGIENVSFEVPTIMKVNDTQNGDIQVSLLAPDMDCQQPPPPPPKASSRPITLTLLLDNVIPPGKANRYIIKNSSEIRGCGVMMKMTLCEKKSSPKDCNEEMTFSFDGSAQTSRPGICDNQKKKKIEEDDDDEPDQPDQRVIQDILKKILSGGINKSSAPSNDLSPLWKNNSGESLAFVLNPSLLHKLPSKSDSIRRATTYSYKSPNPPPDYEHLCKIVQQLSSTIPKPKLVSLLTSLISKVSHAENQ